MCFITLIMNDKFLLMFVYMCRRIYNAYVHIYTYIHTKSILKNGWKIRQQKYYYYFVSNLTRIQNT